MNPSQVPMSSPLTPAPEWDIQDSTKMKTYMDCPRKYFFAYILGWRPRGANKHLHFGSAWHKAMEVMMLNVGKVTVEVVEEAFAAFMEEYRKYFPEEMDHANRPKDPGSAFEALVEYAKRFHTDEFEVLYTEVGGVVPLNEKHHIFFKMDAVCRGEEGIFAMEHKTTGRDSEAWRKEWLLSIQTGTYAHALYVMFPEEMVFGVRVNGVVLRMKDCDFARIPIIRTNEGMQNWLWHILYYMSELDWNWVQLSEATPDDTVLRAFPQRTESCMKYGVCPYHDFCTAWANPLKRAEEPPPGFMVEHWNPTKVETLKYVLSPNGTLLKVEADAQEECGTKPTEQADEGAQAKE